MNLKSITELNIRNTDCNIQVSGNYLIQNKTCISFLSAKKKCQTGAHNIRIKNAILEKNQGGYQHFFDRQQCFQIENSYLTGYDGGHLHYNYCLYDSRSVFFAEKTNNIA